MPLRSQSASQSKGTTSNLCSLLRAVSVWNQRLQASSFCILFVLMNPSISDSNDLLSWMIVWYPVLDTGHHHWFQPVFQTLKCFFIGSHHTGQTLREYHSAFYQREERNIYNLDITWIILPVKTSPKDVIEPHRVQHILWEPGIKGCDLKFCIRDMSKCGD